MVGHREQCVGVGRQVNADDVGLLVGDVVDEARILMAEAVVVLAPYVRGEEIVERCNRPAPGDVARHLQPLRVLIEHRIHDVDERFVAGEDAVPAREQVTFEPSFALMLAQHLHHATIRRHMVVGGEHFRGRAAVG